MQLLNSAAEMKHWSIKLFIFIIIFFASETSSAAIDNASFAIFWPEPGLSVDPDAMFREIFEPQLLQECNRSVRVAFSEFSVPRSPTWEQLEQYSIILATSNFLFAALPSGIAISADARRLLQAFTPSTSPATAFEHRLRWHPAATSAADPLFALSPGLATTARALVGAATASPGAATRAAGPLALVLGAPRQPADVAPLLAGYLGRVIVHRLDAAGDAIDAVIDTILRSEATAICLVATRSITYRFLEVALNTSLWSPDYRWILYDSGLISDARVNLSRTLVPKALREGENITALEFGPYSEKLLAQLPSSQHVLLHDLLSVWTEYLKQLTCGNGTVTQRNLTGLTGQFQLFANGSMARENWRIQIYDGVPLNPDLIGEFTTDGQFSMTPRRLRDVSRATVLLRFRQAPLKVLVILDDPYVRFKRDMKNRSDLPLISRLEGLALDLCIRVLSKRLGLTNISLELLPNAVTVNFDSLSRAADYLSDGRADIVCSDLVSPLPAIIKEPMALTATYATTNFSVLYRQPVANTLDSIFSFVAPFHTHVWLALLGCAAGLALTLAALHRIAPNRQNFDVAYSIYAALTALCQAGPPSRQPNRLSSHFALGAFRLAILLVLAAYASWAAGSRCLRRLQRPIGPTITDLLDQTGYEFGTLANSSFAAHFKDSPLQRMRAMYERMEIRRGLVDGWSEAMAQLEAGKYALIADARRSAYWGLLTCDASMMVYTGVPLAFAFALPKRSDLLPLVNEELRVLVNESTGVMGSLEKMYFSVPEPDRPRCHSDDLVYRLIPEEPPALAPVAGALTLRDLLGLPLVNAATCLLALTAAVLELLVERCRGHCSRNTVDREDSVRSSMERRRSTIVLEKYIDPGEDVA